MRCPRPRRGLRSPPVEASFVRSCRVPSGGGRSSKIGEGFGTPLMRVRAGLTAWRPVVRRNHVQPRARPRDGPADEAEAAAAATGGDAIGTLILRHKPTAPGEQ